MCMAPFLRRMHLNFISLCSPTDATRAKKSVASNSLAGVDDILSQCTDFCLQSFALHTGVGVVHGGKIGTFFTYYLPCSLFFFPKISFLCSILIARHRPFWYGKN